MSGADRSCVVTGGGQGIGRAIVERLLADGDAVVVLEYDPAAVAYLLSPEASFVNGVTLPVDGGRAALGLDPEARLPGP